MSENPNPDLSDELRQFGQSLKNFFKSAWESQERQQIQTEIEHSLDEVARALNQAADDFTQSQQGQQLKAEFDDLKQRVESGELSDKIQNDLKNTLRQVTQELDQAASRWSQPPGAGDESDQQPS
ncbi:MAG: hypothetical protein GYA48_15740 [Chloroflexi bacterium]|nr:hypothetical protein [Chloroflexota bacterium]